MTNVDIPKKRHRISQRQKRWLLAYLTTARLNATEAARTAEYKWPNHSGPENLQKLRRYIDETAKLSWAYMNAHSEQIKAWIDGL